MGTTDSKESAKLTAIYQQYNVANHSDFDCSILTNKKNPTQKLLMKELNLTDEYQFQKVFKKYEAKLSLKHPNIVNIVNFFYIYEQQICGQFYKIYVVYEFYEHSLKQLIEESYSFTEQELISLLKCLVKVFWGGENIRIYPRA
jgi:hypothetical protein